MEQQQFNVGDTVRRTHHDNGLFAKVGQSATVIGIDRDMVIVKYDGHCADFRDGEGWFMCFTELVSAKKAPRIVPGSQSAVLLSIFRAHPSGLTPSYVHTQTQWRGRRWPLTSVRARITKLADAGLLVKEAATKPGIYGKPEHVWRIA